MSKVMTKEEAVALIKDGDTIGMSGSGGGVMEAYSTLQALEQRFLDTGSPNQMTLVHASGIGDHRGGGVGRFAHEGMVKRVIGGHWAWSAEMQQLANENKIEAYNFPQGVIVHLLREGAAHRPGVLTKIGMNTYVDPRVPGGKLNDVTKEDLVVLAHLSGEDWMFYHSIPLDEVIIRGTTAAPEGNISMEHEAALLDVMTRAQAAHNNGSKVSVQVKYLTQSGSLDPRKVRIPGVYVDAVVVDPEQMQTNEGEYNPAFCGDVRIPLEKLPPMPLNPRKIVARRAFMELKEGMVVNLGFGMPDGVAKVAAEEGFSSKVTMTIEQGIYGGVPAGGDIFGVASNPVAFIDEGMQFDFYSGGGLDLTCLGMAQVDQYGNVNSSKFGPTIAGCGGFIDISQPSKKVVFCGTFSAGGFKAEVKDGKLHILQEGKHRKCLTQVEHITFSGQYAASVGQPVLYVTERAVFQLRPEGMTLIEYAPGVDVQKDILDLMDFKPILAPDLKEMPAEIFREGPMNA